MKKIIILMGAPGSGKGTQAKLIARKYRYGHISTGDLLRALEGQENLDPKVSAVLVEMKKGNLVPDWLIFQLAFQAIGEYLSRGQGVVLDGAIRNLRQARAYQEYFEKMGLTIEDILVIEIRIDEQESMERLIGRRVCSGCGEIIPRPENGESPAVCPRCGGDLGIRKDDNADTIKARVAEQGEKIIAPLVEYYDRLGVLTVVDGKQSIDGVWREVETILSK